MIQRSIPSSGENIPVIGIGSWEQFDISDSDPRKKNLLKVLSLMHENGGKVIDSSPMYGRSEKVIGDLSADMQERNDFFYATKVWTTGKQNGIEQMNESFRKMKRETIDLMQIHNLLDCNTHLSTLNEWKTEGRIRYTGVTHYTDASHQELVKIVRMRIIDFVQFNYSILAGNAEKELLGACSGNGVAVIINVPFASGKIFSKIRNKKLPEWAAEYNIQTWSQLFLKYIISHPAVTCVIPGTSDPDHIVENMQAGEGPLPDAKTRARMLKYVEGDDLII